MRPTSDVRAADAGRLAGGAGAARCADFFYSRSLSLFGLSSLFLCLLILCLIFFIFLLILFTLCHWLLLFTPTEVILALKVSIL